MLADLEALRDIISKKEDDILKEQPLSALDTFKISIDEVLTLINTYNENINLCNAEIAQLKIAPPLDQSLVESELKRLRIVENRFSEGNKKLCKEYSTKKVLINILNEIKTKKQEELSQYSKSVFDKYRDKINYFLSKFAPLLEIADAKSVYKGTSIDPYAEYVIKINSYTVKFEDDSQSPCIKNSLSEGDKTAIALAFFLAKLELDPDISKKIIVFDDPLSSFDRNRKDATLAELKRLEGIIEQSIILTHNAYFARDLLENSVQKNSCHSLMLGRAGSTSVLMECDIVRETAGAYYNNYLTLEKFLLNGAQTQTELRDIARCIRPLLESYLLKKFPNKFNSKEWLGDYLGKIRSSTAGDPLYKLSSKLAGLNDINDFSKKYHHSSNASADAEPITATELETYCNRTLDFIYS